MTDNGADTDASHLNTGADSNRSHEPAENHHSHDVDAVGVAVVTISTSRTLENDPAGVYIVEAVEADGHDVVVRELIADDFDSVQSTIDRLVNRSDTDAIITTGGTGVTPDDVTPQAATPLFDRTLPGFGELFRRLSYEEVGTKTIGSRAVAGVADGVPVFCLPGSENAVRLGVDAVILPEVGHLVGLAKRA